MRAARAELALDLAAMAPLPKFKTTDFSIVSALVTRSGTMSVRDVYYTVPSRLVGHRLKVHVYDDRLICYLGAAEVLQLARVRQSKRRDRRVVVDYRHIIHALVKKPQAFRRYVHRDALFPRDAFKRAWEMLEARLDERRACRIYVGLLHLAATYACEARLVEWLEGMLDRRKLPDLEAARLAMAPAAIVAPSVSVSPPDARTYDRLISFKSEIAA